MKFLATRAAGLVIDASVLGLAYWGAYALRFDFQDPRWGWTNVALSFLTVCAAYLLALVVCGCYRLSWRLSSLRDFPRYVGAAILACGTLTVLRALTPVESYMYVRPPYSVILISFVLSAVGLVGWRLLWRWYAAETISEADLLERRVRHMDSTAAVEFIRGKTVMITGAGGSIGSELVRQVAMAAPKVLEEPMIARLAMRT